MKNDTTSQLARIIGTAMLLLGLLVCGQVAASERIKDLASIQGVRPNQLVGYGIVVGLDGSGDQTSQVPFAVQSIRNMLQQFGVSMPDNVNPRLENVAAVTVNAELPPFVKPGQRIDISVSSIGNASSLRGGTLLMTPLRGADGQVYAIAQGNLVVGGLGVEGRDGSRISVNIPSGGRVPDGATVEREVPMSMAQNGAVILNLHSPDFTTAHRMAEEINTHLGENSAVAVDAVSVSVQAPDTPGQQTGFVAWLQELTVEAGEPAARVIVNSRTGTVVIGNHVRLRPAAVSHGALTVKITERFDVEQPQPFAPRPGEAIVTPRTGIEVEQEDARMFLLDPGIGLDELVRAVNQVGAAPGDLVAILEALKQAGSLRAELIII